MYVAEGDEEGDPVSVCATPTTVADGVPDADPVAMGVVATDPLTDGTAVFVADADDVEDDASPEVTLADGELVEVPVLELLPDVPGGREATAVDEPEADGTGVTDAGAVLDGLLTGEAEDAADDDGVGVVEAVSAPLGVADSVEAPEELGDTP